MAPVKSNGTAQWPAPIGLDELGLRSATVTILALDAGGAACSVAIRRNGACAAHAIAAMRHGHAEAIMPMVAAAMRDAAIGFRDLDLVAVTVGPGGFTGLRIGLATARGIGMAARIPIVGVSSFAAVAEGTLPIERHGRETLVVLDSRRAELYAQAFDRQLAPVGEPRRATPDAIATTLSDGPWLVAGDGCALLRPHLETGAARQIAFALGSGVVDAAVVARIAARIVDGEAAALPPTPLYIHPVETTLPRRAS